MRHPGELRRHRPAGAPGPRRSRRLFGNRHRLSESPRAREHGTGGARAGRWQPRYPAGALPVRPQVILAVKTAVGVASCALPLAACALFTCAIAGGRELSTGQILNMYALGTGAVLSLFIWMFAASVELPTEARAGLISLGILVIWLIGSGGLAAAGPAFFWAVSPFGFLPFPEIKQMPSPLSAGFQTLIDRHEAKA